MKKLLFCLSALFVALSVEAAKSVSVHYYMGDVYGNNAVGFVDPYQASIGSLPYSVTATNAPAGWKVTDWLTAVSSAAVQDIARCTSTGVSSWTYTFTENPADNSALAVRFDPITYRLSFDTGDGTPFSSAGPYLSTNEVSLAEYKGTLEGYSFAGWSNEYATVAFDHTETFTGVEKLGLGNADTNVTLHAVWTANVYTVTFRFRDRRGVLTNVTQQVEYGKDAVPPADEEVNTWQGHRFTGWAGSYAAVAKDETVTAQYGVASYTVIFDPNAEDATGTMMDQTINCGDERNLRKNAFKRKGYTFSRWDTKSDGTGDSYADTETVSDLTYEDGGIVTLYAQWAPITYIIAFDGNGGDGEMEPTNVAYGAEVELPANSFANSGWEFKGWEYIDDSGAVTNHYADGATVKNLTTNDGATVTLVAQWGDYQPELQRAVHGNLPWDGINVSPLDSPNKWHASPGGYNGSGSCAEQTGMAGDALTATVTTNGVLSFWCRTLTEVGKLCLAVNQSQEAFWPESVVTNIELSLKWRFVEIAVDFSQHVQSRDKLYLRFAVVYDDQTVQIDQVKWVPEGGDEPESEIDMTLTGYSGKYDGAAHGVTVGGTNGIAGVECEFATGATPPPADGWVAEPPLFTNAGTVKVWCVASAPGYLPKTNSADVVISRREVSLTSGSESKEYDESELTNDEVLVGGDGFVDGEGATFDVTGSQTDVGSSANTFTYELNEGTTAANYAVTTTFGTLTVTKATYDMDGVEWDYEGPFDYDGSKKTVALVGLPDGLSVSYDGNSARSPGEYAAVATFTSASPNYETPEAMFLEWQIVLPGDVVYFPGEGKVTAPKSWTVGKAATWKAVAEKGSVFAHWEGKAVADLGLTRNELRNPSLKFVVPEDFDADGVEAVFIAVDSDGLSSLWLSSDEVLDLGAAVDGLEVLDDSESYVTASVSGLPSGLKFDKKTMKITGSPKKSGAFIVKITAKNASGYQWAENVALLVKDADGNVPRKPIVPEPKRTAYHSLTVVSSDLAAGTVSGTGVYAEGKKASISAKPAKGFAFGGWYCDAALTTPMGFASGDYRKPSQSVVIPEVRCLFAQFVKATAEADPISGLVAKGSGFSETENCFKWCVGVAVPEGDGVEFESISLPSASAAKLPSGVKFDAAKCCFTGVPTKAGTYEATVTVKNASKSADTLKLTIEVAALDAWAQGSFNGEVRNGESASAEATADKQGTVSLTIAANGKISGKLLELEGGKTWTLSAASFSRVENVEDVEMSAVFYATVIGKAGKEVATNEIAVAAVDGIGVLTGTFELSNSQTFELTSYQNLWKRADTKAAQPVFKKSIGLALENGLNLTFKKDGAVSFAGTVGGSRVSGSSQLVHAESGWQVTLYAPPKGAFAGYCETIAVALKIGEGNVVTEVEIR